MVEPIRDDRIDLIEERFEYPVISIKRSCKKDTIIVVKIISNGGLKLLVKSMRAANKSDGCKARTCVSRSFDGSFDHPFICREPEIVISTKI